MDTDHHRRDPGAVTARHDTEAAPPKLGVPKAEAFGHVDGRRPSPAAADSLARWRGGEVRWVRAGDALAQTSGRATGRGIVWTTQANRLPRLVPLRPSGIGRRAIDRASTSPRTSRLAPLTAFGTRRGSSIAGLEVSR